jgi:hypothetical protein
MYHPNVIRIVQVEIALKKDEDVSKIVQDVIDNVQAMAIETVRARWVEMHLDDINNWPSIGHALQAWFDEVREEMRRMMGLL